MEKISYERRAYKSVDDGSLSNGMSLKFTEIRIREVTG